MSCKTATFSNTKRSKEKYVLSSNKKETNYTTGKALFSEQNSLNHCLSMDTEQSKYSKYLSPLNDHFNTN